MKLHDLHPFELFDVQPEQGLIQLSRHRYQLLSMAATGLHRRDVVVALGAQARRLLLRYGYAQGFFDALCAADRMKRIAAPMVGGLVTSFVLELLVYPAVYLLWKRRGLVRDDRTGEVAGA